MCLMHHMCLRVDSPWTPLDLDYHLQVQKQYSREQLAKGKWIAFDIICNVVYDFAAKLKISSNFVYFISFILKLQNWRI